MSQWKFELIYTNDQCTFLQEPTIASLQAVACGPGYLDPGRNQTNSGLPHPCVRYSVFSICMEERRGRAGAGCREWIKFLVSLQTRADLPCSSCGSCSSCPPASRGHRLKEFPLKISIMYMKQSPHFVMTFTFFMTS